MSRSLLVLALISLASCNFLPIGLNSTVNPFDPSMFEMFANPWFAKEVEDSATLSSSQKDKIKNQPAAFWVDTNEAIETRTPSLKDLLEAAKEKQAQGGKKQTVTYIHYNLPNRDCHAAASNGQICCSGNAPDPTTGNCDSQSYSGGCSAGLNMYHQYTDEIVSLLQNYAELQVVAIIEPDSLPNLATNLGSGHCTQTTAEAYKQGVAYTLSKLGQLSHVVMYMDIAHGGWLGWCGSHPCSSGNECGGGDCLHGYCECDATRGDQNAQKFIKIIQDVWQNAGSQAMSKVRGFATNTANYQPLGHPSDEDFCNLKSQWNFMWNEVRFMDFMDKLMKKNSINPHWITDTGRNGEPSSRTGAYACQQWCNIKGGLGFRPTADVSEVQSKLQSAKLDALVWAKTPGESDGCSPNAQQKCTRVDSMCTRDCYSGYQKCPAPEAGQWDDTMIKYLADHASPSL